MGTTTSGRLAARILPVLLAAGVLVAGGAGQAHSAPVAPANCNNDPGFSASKDPRKCKATPVEIPKAPAPSTSLCNKDPGFDASNNPARCRG